MMKYKPDNPPIPLLESSLKGKFRHDIDEYVPQGGFVQDFVLYTRGIETPTKFAVWAALYTVSALLKRDAYMEWFPDPLYPNLYLMFVAPPRICAKSTCVKIGAKILDMMQDVYDDAALKAGKTINIHRGKATPEMLFDLMKPKKFDLEDGKKIAPTGTTSKSLAEQAEEMADRMVEAPAPAEQTGELFTGISDISLIIEELTTFLGKQKYNEALVDVLTHFYDCPDTAEEATRTYGAQVLKDVYMTFFGATTPDAFNSSLPETAFGGGFLSRTIIVANYLPTRSFPMPSRLAGAPDKDEIGERLAWVGSTALGGYKFSKEAYDEYVSWYHQFKEDLVGDPLADAKARLDTNLIKLCVLLRAQRYERGNIISKQDFIDARMLIDAAFMSAQELYSGVSASEYYNQLRMIERFLEKERKAPRAVLLKKFSLKKITPDLLTKIVSHLQQQQLVEVLDSGGRPIDLQTEHPLETIRYIGTENET